MEPLGYTLLGRRLAQCNAHLLRRCVEMLEVQRGETALFPQQVKELLKQAIQLGRARKLALELWGERFWQRAVSDTEQQFANLLAPAQSDPANRRFRKHLKAHQSEVLAFLPAQPRHRAHQQPRRARDPAGRDHAQGVGGQPHGGRRAGARGPRQREAHRRTGRRALHGPAARAAQISGARRPGSRTPRAAGAPEAAREQSHSCPMPCWRWLRSCASRRVRSPPSPGSSTSCTTTSVNLGVDRCEGVPARGRAPCPRPAASVSLP